MDLIPDYLIDTFHRRIADVLKDVDKDHPSVKRELDRILKINGNKIPDKIKELLK